VNLDHITQEMCAAMALANMEIANPKKTSANPYFKSKYADLSEVIQQIRQVYATFGLSIVQSGGIFESGWAEVTTTILHSSGGYITTSCRCATGKEDAQAAGSNISYLRRYSLLSICCLAQEDDDGESISIRTTATRLAQAPAPAPAPAPAKAPVEEFVSPADVAEILSLIEQTGSDLEKFAVWNGGQLTTMTLSKYQTAKSKLLVKLP
jgi:hypothetical protein